MSKLYKYLNNKLPRPLAFIITLVVLSALVVLIYAFSIESGNDIGYLNI